MAAKVRNPALYRNWVSYVGGMLTVAGVLLVVFSSLMQFSIKHPGPYFGIFTFMIFPAVILGGVFIWLIGMRRESLRRRRAGSTEALPYPKMDLNDPRQRRRFALGSAIAASLSVVLAFVAYNAFLLSESVAFCGKTCHTQMEPEMTAYENSPHARVRCVDCHVGEGAGHYAQSKLNGVRQLVGVVFNSYDTPIATPVKGLRPATETCQECHWPEKNWGTQLYQRPHFRYDEKNTPEQLTMLMKTGGGKGVYGGGIHWHMQTENEVTYVAEDQHLQQIPWVRIKRSDGSVTEYFRTENKIEPSAVASMQQHKMDCMDCHNRPAHNFQTPDVAIDKALAATVISSTLPWIKTQAVQALSKEYPSRDAAHAAIQGDIAAYYASTYPDIATARAADITTAINAIIDIYDKNVFPDMKVSWKTYQSNLGHRNSAGCFRCHDGKHVSPTGSVIISECKACHTEPQRGPQSGMGEALAKGGEKNWHPWDTPQKHLEVTKHAEILCHECHLDGRKPKTECNECHTH